MEEKIKEILKEMIGEIDGDWAVFMSAKYYDELADKFTEKIMGEIKEGNN